MNFCIHHGTKEIGGSCVEVWTDTTRIVIDIGMPLIEKDGTNFDFKKYKSHSRKLLIEEKVLPNIPGLYDDSDKKIDGVLISHAHQDHYGFYEYINKKIQFHMGEATFYLIEITGIFTGNKTKIENKSFFKTNRTFSIGDIKITPYLMDHSAFDSYAFLLENNNNSIFYSGDFREHGRKKNMFKWFTHNCPKNVDYLILEGTNVGSEKHTMWNEDDIEMEAFKIFSENDKINFIYTSGQNIDRIVSFYKAAKKSKKLFVIDPYLANILDYIGRYARIPFPSIQFNNIKVFFAPEVCSKLKRQNNEQLSFKFKQYKITKEEIARRSNEIIMFVRPGLIKSLKKLSMPENGNLIYSLWKGYKEKSYVAEFIKYFQSKGFNIINLHTGGHADINTLKLMVDSMKPKNIVPIHTFNQDIYKKYFNEPIKIVRDMEIVIL